MASDDDREIVRCQSCAADVNAERVASYSYDDEFGTVRVTLLRCPSCSSPLLVDAFSPDDETWMMRKRLYPPEGPARTWLPVVLRRTMQEAERCFEARVFLACAVTCRRALDILCHHYDAKGRNLADKLKGLRSRNIIDETLSAWAQALREDGNLAAHDPDPGITRDDAQYMLQFTRAMLDHVFLLRERFEAYQKRREGRRKRKQK